MDDEAERTLYCGNLDSRVTEDILFELFIQVRNVTSFLPVQNSRFTGIESRLYYVETPRPFINPLM